jgi:hypothetical protein
VKAERCQTTLLHRIAKHDGIVGDCRQAPFDVLDRGARFSAAPDEMKRFYADDPRQALEVVDSGVEAENTLWGTCRRPLWAMIPSSGLREGWRGKR